MLVSPSLAFILADEALAAFMLELPVLPGCCAGTSSDLLFAVVWLSSLLAVFADYLELELAWACVLFVSLETAEFCELVVVEFSTRLSVLELPAVLEIFVVFSPVKIA